MHGSAVFFVCMYLTGVRILARTCEHVHVIARVIACMRVCVRECNSVRMCESMCVYVCVRAHACKMHCA